MIPIRQHYIGPSQQERVSLNFAKWIRGMEVAQDAVLELDKFKKSKYRNSYINEERITRALEEQDRDFLRELSNYFYGISGIYARFVKYLAGILTYDWYAYPYMLKDGYSVKNVRKDINIVLNYLDNVNIKTTFYDASLGVILMVLFMDT